MQIHEGKIAERVELLGVKLYEIEVFVVLSSCVSFLVLVAFLF